MTIVRVLSLCFDSHTFLNVFNSMVYLETGSRSVFILTLSVQYFDILRIVFVCPICQSQLARCFVVAAVYIMPWNYQSLECQSDHTMSQYGFGFFGTLSFQEQGCRLLLLVPFRSRKPLRISRHSTECLQAAFWERATSGNMPCASAISWWTTWESLWRNLVRLDRSSDGACFG